MNLTPDDVRWVASLARLSLNDAEAAEVAQQLRKVLDHFEHLSEVDTESVEPLAHPLAITNVFREDEPEASLAREEALANAPRSRDQFFVVPAVFDD